MISIKLLGQLLKERTMPIDHFLKSIERDSPVRVPGLAVYMHGNPDVVPRA